MSGLGRRLDRLGAAYSRTRGGRRLQQRLRRARIGTTPARWRAGQLAVAVPLLLVALLVAGPGLGLALALGAVRTGGLLVLRLRERGHHAALERGAPLLARCLGAELAAGAGASDALSAAAGPLLRTEPAMRPLVEMAAGLAALGETPGAALAAAVAAEGGAAASVVPVAALLALHGRAGGEPEGFDRLAAALEAAVATRDDARAITAEARLAAAGVPILAGILGIVLAATEPSIGAGAASPLAAAVLAGCAAVAVAGAVLARRLAAVP